MNSIICISILIYRTVRTSPEKKFSGNFNHLLFSNQHCAEVTLGTLILFIFRNFTLIYLSCLFYVFCIIVSVELNFPNIHFLKKKKNVLQNVFVEVANELLHLNNVLLGLLSVRIIVACSVLNLQMLYTRYLWESHCLVL